MIELDVGRPSFLAMAFLALLAEVAMMPFVLIGFFVAVVAHIPQLLFV